MSIGPVQPPMPPPPGEGEQDILAVLSQPENQDLLQEVLAELPPPIVAQIEQIPIPERNQMLKEAMQRVLERLQAQEQGPPPGPVGPGMPPPGAMPGGMGGQPPPNSPPPSSPLSLEGPPGQMGGPSPLPVPEPQTPEEADYLAEVDEDEKELPAPDDWEPEALTDLYGKGYAWRDKPEHEELCRLAQDALDDTFWQERNNACFDQAHCYYRSKIWTKLNGLPFQVLQGELIYMLSTPSKQVDRIVSRCQPRPENLTFSLDARSEREEYTDAQQYVENFGRDLWRKFCVQWWRNLAQTRLGTSLPRTVTHLATLHGAAGFSIRPDVRRRKGATKRDINAHQPIIIDVIPQHELYLLGDCTLRIQSVNLKEARRLSRVVRQRWPSRAKEEDKDGKWTPPEDHPTRLISFSDEHGKWYAQCFDLCVTKDQREKLGPDDAPQHWTIPPEPIDFGRCLFQLPPGWQSTADNALPDDRQPAENFGRNFARGALFTNLGDFVNQDQVASAALSAFLYNRDPTVLEKINYKLRAENGQAIPEKIKIQLGGREQRDVSEDAAFLPKPFGDNAGDNAFMSLTFSQTADTFPAAMGGGGAAQSGYDRRQMVENAQLLHVEEIRNYVAGWVELLVQCCLELVYRYGTGKKPKFSELPFRLSSGGVGEARLTMQHIERAGVDVEVQYFEEDIEAELRKNNIYLPRMAAKALSVESAMEKFGTDDIEREQDRLDTEFALTHPDVQMGKALLAMTRGRHPILPFLREAAAMSAMQKAGPQGMPGMPGLPSMPSAPGVPAGGGQPSVARGLPPDMKVPNAPGM